MVSEGMDAPDELRPEFYVRMQVHVYILFLDVKGSAAQGLLT